MRVLMVNTPASAQFVGGDTVQMRRTATALAEFGVQADLSCDAEPDPTGYDLAHVFNLRTVAATGRQVLALKRRGIPIVMSPIYLNPGFALWGGRIARHIFGRERSPAELARLLDAFPRRQLRIGNGGREFAADKENRTRSDYDDRQRAILDAVAHLLPNSHLEMHCLVQTLRVCHLPFTVVPYACDPDVFLDPDPEPFVAQHQVRDFVLQVGRIEASKNQVMLAHALRGSGLRLVLIGANLQPGYLEACRRYGPKDLLVLPHLPPEELRSAYAAARVHALPSWIETCGLATMEAALGGCEVVASIAGYELEYYRDFAHYCDPCDVASIRKAVLEAYAGHATGGERRRALRALIQREYTWQRAAEKTCEAYRAVLERRRAAFG